MTTRVVSDDSYTASWNPETNEVSIRGSLRLGGTVEYAPIAALLDDGLGAGPLVVDLRGLEFLNSSGISMLMRLAIKVRDTKGTLRLRGSKKISWQGKSLQNLKRVCAAIGLEFE